MEPPGRWAELAVVQEKHCCPRPEDVTSQADHPCACPCASLCLTSADSILTCAVESTDVAIGSIDFLLHVLGAVSSAGLGVECQIFADLHADGDCSNSYALAGENAAYQCSSAKRRLDSAQLAFRSSCHTDTSKDRIALEQSLQQFPS